MPEVADTSLWRDNRLWWYDTFEPYTTLNYQGIAQAYLTRNTNLVDPNELTAWMDLLNPKWKGKIVSIDPRRSTRGGGAFRFTYWDPNLGPKYLKRLFGEMDITLSASSRQLVEWLARGRFHLAIGVGSLTVERAAAQGLPVALVPTQRFKEGAPMSSSGGTIALMARSPHPNASKVFINWFLSREGQMAWQRRTRQNSLRIDVPKDRLRPANTPIPGQTYTFHSTEKIDTARKEVLAHMRRLLDQLGK